MSTPTRNFQRKAGAGRSAILATSIAAFLAFSIAPQAHAQLLFVSDYSGGVVDEVNPNNGVVVNSSAQDVSAFGIAVAGDVLYYGNNTGVVETLTNPGLTVTNSSFVTGITSAYYFLAANTSALYVSDPSTGIVSAYDPSSGNALAGFAPISGLRTGGFQVNPVAVAGSNLYVANTFGNSVGLYNPGTGAPTKGNFISVGDPYGLALSGNLLYVLDCPGANNEVSVYNATTGALINSNLLGSANLNSAGSIVVSGGNLYVTNTVSGSGSTVDKYDATTGKLIQAGFVSGLTGSGTLAFDNQWPINVTGDYVPNNSSADVSIQDKDIGYGPGDDSVYPGSVVATINSLTQTASQACTIDMFKGQTLIVANGIVVNGSAGTLTIGDTPGTGTLSGGYGPGTAGLLTLQDNSDSVLTVNAVVANNGTGVVSLLVQGTGTVVFAANNTYTGPTEVETGVLQIGTNTDAASLSSKSAVSIGDGGELVLLNITGGLFANSVSSVAGSTGTLVVNSSSAVTLSGTLADGDGGELALTQSGTGTTTLTNAKNTYSGATMITGGTLQIGSDTMPGSIGPASAVTINSATLLLTNVANNLFANDVADVSQYDATVNVNSDNNLTISGALTDGGAGNGLLTLVQSGPKTTTLTNAGNTYSGATTVSSGTLQIGTTSAAGSIGTGAVGISSGGTLMVVSLHGNTLSNSISNGMGGIGTLVIDSANAVTLSGALTDGAGGQLALTQRGTGTTTLTNSGNTYSAATTISGGILQVGTPATAGSLGPNSAVGISNNATLELVNLANNTLANHIAGAGTLSINSANINTLSGDLTNLTAGTLALRQSGAGTTILTGTGNTYTGATTISAGTLQVGTDATPGSIGTGNITVDDATTLLLVNVNSGNVPNNIASGTAGLGQLTINSANTVTLSGAITDTTGGEVALAQSGAGTTVLTNGHNTYAGSTTITGGILQIGIAKTAGSLGTAETVAVGNGGLLGLVNVSGNTFAKDVTNGISGTGTLVIGSEETVTVSGTLTDGGGGQLALEQIGPGTTIVTDAGNTYSGATTVSGGVLQIGAATVAGSIGASSAISVGTGGTLSFVDIGATEFTSDITNGLGGVGIVEVDYGKTLTFSGVLSDGAAGQMEVHQVGTGTTILTGVNTLTGGATISAGTLQLGNGTSGAFDGPIEISGTGTLVLDLPDGSTLGSTIASTAKTDIAAIQSGTTTLSGDISGSVGFTQSGSGKTMMTGANTYTGVTTVSAGTLQVQGSLSGTSSVYVSAGTLQVDGLLSSGGSVDVDAAGTLSGKGAIEANVALNGGIINFNGGSISEALVVASGIWSGPGSVAGLITSTSGVFTINSSLVAPTGLKVTGGALAGMGTLTGSLNDISSSSFTFAGTMVDGMSPSALTLNHSGSTLTLTGTNTYTGATTVTAGTLVVNGSLANTTVTVASSGTLGGTGTIGGVATVNGTLTHAAGGPGTITLGGLILTSGAKSNYDLGVPGVVGGAVNDLTQVNGNLTLGGTFNISALFGFGTGSYDIMNYTGTLTPGSVKIGTVPAGFTPSEFSISTAINGQVDLVVNGGPAVQDRDGAVNTGNGTVTGGNGSWDNVTTNWTNFIGTKNAKWAQSTAIFSAGTGTVTVGDNINTVAIGFINGAGAYTLNVSPGKALNITGTGVTNTSGTLQSFATSVGIGAGQVGTINFTNSASAGSQTQITNNGGMTANNYGGGTYFKNNSTAATAAITNQGSSVSGSLGGFVEFDNSASAGSATLTNNGGSNGGGGGGTYFTATSTGGTAQAIANGNGLVDISGLTSNGMSIGSIAGSGDFFLGKKALTVGGNGMNATVSGVISDGGFMGGTGGSLVKVGAGTLVLSGANTYTGATTISAGTLEVDGSLAAKSTVAVTTTGTLTGSGSIPGNATLTGNGVIDFGSTGNIGGTLTATGGNWNGAGSVTGVVTSSSGTLTIGTNDDLTAAGGLKLTGGTLAGTGTLSGILNDTSSSNFTFGGPIADGSMLGAVTMNHSGSTLTLAGANTYTGATTVTAGTLQIGNGTAGSLSNSSAVTIATGATLALDLPSNASLSNTVTNNGHLTATGTTNNFTLASAVTGTGNFTKGGSNTVTLTGANSYTGGTTISAGTLLADNTTGSATGTGAVAVNSGATLGGSGTITGATMLNSGGTIEPGAGSPGTAGTTLHASSLIWNGNGALAFQAGAGGVSDELSLTGALTKGAAGTYTIDLLNVGITTTATNDTLITFSTTTFSISNFKLVLPLNVTGTLAFNGNKTALMIDNLVDPPAQSQSPENGDADGGVIVGGSNDDNGSQTSTANDKSVANVTATPEPGSTLLLTLGIGTLLGWKRRRRK